MTLYVALLALAAINAAALVALAYFHYKTTCAQQKMIQNLAIFKKASEPWQVAAVASGMDAAEQNGSDVQPDPVMEEPTIPNNPSDSFMKNLRDNI